MTTALLHTFPLPSHNLPKRIALIGFSEGFSCAQRLAAASASNIAADISLAIFMHPSFRQRRIRSRCEATETWPRDLTSNSVGEGMQLRSEENYCGRRTVGDEGLVISDEELTCGMGGARPAVCEPRPSFCKVFASSLPDGFSPCAS